MPYRVFWSPDAERLFKNLLAAAPSDAAALAHAAAFVDNELHADPTNSASRAMKTCASDFNCRWL